MDAYDYVTSFKVCEFTKNINLNILWKKHFFSWFIYYMLMAVIWEKINIGGNHQHFETISVNWNVEAILLPTMKKELVCLEKRPMEFFFGKAFEKMYFNCILWENDSSQIRRFWHLSAKTKGCLMLVLGLTIFLKRFQTIRPF